MSGNFDLRTIPDEAREIGLLTMFVSNLGVMIVPMLAALMNGDDFAAHTLGVKIDSVSAKVDILLSLAEHLAPNDELAKAIFAEKSAIKSAIAMRNKLAHSLYVFDSVTGQPELYENLITDRRGRPRAISLDAKEIGDVGRALEDAVIRILKAGGDRIRHPFDGHLRLPQQ